MEQEVRVIVALTALEERGRVNTCKDNLVRSVPNISY